MRSREDAVRLVKRLRGEIGGKAKKQNKQAPKPNFVLINRSIFEWEWWGDIYVTHFFIGLILLANHEDKWSEE